MTREIKFQERESKHGKGLTPAEMGEKEAECDRQLTEAIKVCREASGEDLLASGYLHVAEIIYNRKNVLELMVSGVPLGAIFTLGRNTEEKNPHDLLESNFTVFHKVIRPEEERSEESEEIAGIEELANEWIKKHQIIGRELEEKSYRNRLMEENAVRKR